jgi:hypothetical protein
MLQNKISFVTLQFDAKIERQFNMRKKKIDSSDNINSTI